MRKFETEVVLTYALLVALLCFPRTEFVIALGLAVASLSFLRFIERKRRDDMLLLIERIQRMENLTEQIGPERIQKLEVQVQNLMLAGSFKGRP